MEEMNEVDLTETLERLNAAAAGLESAAKWLVEKHQALELAASECVEKIVATAESAREMELEQKLSEAEQTIAELRASATMHGGRKTVVAGGLQAKGVEAISEFSAVDAALTSLSIEQRFAVKAEMLRSGLLR